MHVSVRQKSARARVQSKIGFRSLVIVPRYYLLGVVFFFYLPMYSEVELEYETRGKEYLILKINIPSLSCTRCRCKERYSQRRGVHEGN